jgi:PAS domain S-box-containing protein
MLSMSDVRLAPKRTWFSAFSSRWRLYLVLALASILPLLLFLYASHWLVRKISISNLLSQSGQAADTAGKVVDDALKGARLAIKSFASDPVTVDVWKRRDLEFLAARLRVAHELKPEITFWGMYDSKGVLRVSYPESGAKAGRSFASSDWFAGAMQTGAPYLSSGLGPGDTSGGFVITIAAPLGCGQCGVLAATYVPQTIKNWLLPMQIGATQWISIVDQNGIVMVAPDRDPSAYLRNVSAHESVKKAMMGQSGTEILWQDGKRMLVSRHPLSSLGWVVLVEIPLEELDKELWKYERPLGLLGLLFDGIALALGGTFAVLYRRLRESREHVQQILATSHDAFVAIDERGVVTKWNPAAEALFGYSESEAVGQPLQAAIIPPRYREAHVRGLERFLTTGVAVVLNKRLELTALHRGGRELPIELSISHVSSSGRNSFNAFIRDISEAKRSQEEIGSLNAELRRDIAELEARNKELEAFNYSVSHDVGAPLRHIIGFSSILSNELAHDITPAALEYVEKIQNGAVRLQQLVTDLLRFSRLGTQELNLHATDLGALVKQVIFELKPESAGRRVNFEVCPLPTVECDSGLVKQVFWNLISNAIKFTAAREIASVEIGRQDETGVFFVRDNGAGFSMKYADKLFAPFQRLHSQEEFAGTGVGLAIVQRILSKHNGRIWAESEVNQGATFFFTLAESSRSRDRDDAGMLLGQVAGSL